MAARHNEAIDCMESCLSAAHRDVGDRSYRLRLRPYKDDILELLAMFEKDEREHTHMMQLILNLFDGEKLDGFEVNAYAERIERFRKRVKGKLVFTRTILMDGDKKAKCLSPATHGKGCRCKNYAKFKLAEGKIE
jgi:hypothetical protein